jgi:hypothetical protein
MKKTTSMLTTISGWDLTPSLQRSINNLSGQAKAICSPIFTAFL